MSLPDFDLHRVRRDGERIRKRRVKGAGYWQKWLSPQSARTPRNQRKHAVVGKKKPTPKGWFFLYWWWGVTTAQTASE